MTQTVQDVMTTELVLCDSSTSLTDAARMMRDQDIGEVLVTDGGELRGIVTDRDIVVRCVAEGSDISQSTLADACSAELISIAPDTSLDEAAQVMRDRAVRRTWKSALPRSEICCHVRPLSEDLIKPRSGGTSGFASRRSG